MRCFILLLMGFAMCALAQRKDAQPASQEDINRALEVLHNTPAVAPPPAAKPGVPLKITSTSTNPASAMTPARTQPVPTARSPLTEDMERRAREVLNSTKAQEPTQPTPNPAREAVERANAHEELRKQAVAETRRGLPQSNTAQPATLAEEEQHKAQEEIDRQKNLERIELEVQRARLAREQKAAETAANKTNAPAATTASQTNAPTPTVVASAGTNTPPPVAAKAPTNAAPALVAATPPAAPSPQPTKPAPTIHAQPVTPPPAPAAPTLLAQQTPAPTPAAPPKPSPAAAPQTAPAAQTNVAFKGLAPDMEQRARDILNQVMTNTKNAQLPVIATQPPKSATVIPGPKPQPQPQPPTTAATPPPAPVRSPDVTPPPAAPAPSKSVTPEQEAKARELLNQLLAKPVPTPTPTPAPQSTAVQQPTPAPPVVEKQPAPAPTVVQKQPAPAPKPAPPIVQQQPAPAPSPTVATKAPAAEPKPEVAAPITSDQEAKARELLDQLLARPAPAPAPTAVPKNVPAPAPVASKPVEPANSEAGRAVPAEPKATPTPAPQTAKPSAVDRRAEEDARRQAKLKAEIDEQTRREIVRMEEESQARAKEMAKRRMEEEKKAQNHKAQAKPEATPTVAAAKPAPTAVRNTPEPTEAKPKPTEKAKPEKSKGGKENGAAKANAPLQETWKDASKSREQRLAELLDAYRTDKISAEKYHSERAKILTPSQ